MLTSESVGNFQKYNLYQSLAAAGIAPTRGKTYTLSELESALESSFGVSLLICTLLRMLTPPPPPQQVKAEFHCSHGKDLNQIYIYFNLRGSVIDGTFTAIGALRKVSAGELF
jgi:ribonuclease T2